ncbi:MAG: nicotinate-nucleotide pyrophosphorylase [Methanolinea sp. SDB]|nr:MAG: nicotinate-nucleotide pyrophosphorylase [Methanolinea sp. SDB]
MVTLEYLLAFIEEDAPYGDITTQSLTGGDSCQGTLVARQDGTIAGLEEASMLFSHFRIDFIPKVSDGMDVSSGSRIALLKGPVAGMLLVERTALNIIGRMSGIATRTRKIRSILTSHNVTCRIASTRKTAPGLRLLDKKAVALGGGEWHRLGLSDGILIKDNHLAFQSIEEAVGKAKGSNPYHKIEIEVESPEEAFRAAKAGAAILLLDNMQPGKIRDTIRILDEEEIRGGLLIEVSGGIHEGNVLEYAIPGVDIISMGSLTHTVENFDISLDIVPSEK